MVRGVHDGPRAPGTQGARAVSISDDVIVASGLVTDGIGTGLAAAAGRCALESPSSFSRPFKKDSKADAASTSGSDWVPDDDAGGRCCSTGVPCATGTARASSGSLSPLLPSISRVCVCARAMMSDANRP